MMYEKNYDEISFTTKAIIGFAAFHCGCHNIEDKRANIVVERLPLKSLHRWGDQLKIEVIGNLNFREPYILVYSKYYQEEEWWPVEADRAEDVIYYFLGHNGIEDVKNIKLEVF